jgi:predicted ATP-dependent endonuclease of OLD family
MKLESIKLQNVRSFKDSIEISLGKGINLFIGPNREGKSNLLDVIVITLRRYVLYNWALIDVNVGNPIRKSRTTNLQQLYDPPSSFQKGRLKIILSPNMQEKNFRWTRHCLLLRK